jgi:hypothetical protein
MGGWRTLAIWAAVAMTALEVIDAPTIDAPLIAILFAVLFLAGAWLTRRGGASGLIMLAVLSVIELAFLPTYERNNAFDWTVQVAVGVASLVCLVGSAGALAESRRTGRTPLPG